MVGIYKITSPTSRVYIGQSINIAKRQLAYRYGKGKGAQHRLTSSIRKYGWDAHIFEVVELCPTSDLNTRERHWQDYYNVLGPKGLNCKLTGDFDKSGKLTDKIRNKIKKALTGIKHTDERRLNQRNAQLGKKRTTEHIEATRQANIKRFESKEARERQGVKLRKPVIQYTMDLIIIQEWASVREASRTLNIDSGTITNCCNGKRHYKSAGGFIWKYKPPQQKQSNTP